MNGFEVKEVMEQVHISSEMQEEIIMNIQNQMENGVRRKTKSGGKRKWSLRTIGIAAAALVLVVGVLSIPLQAPVQAMVTSIVKARMESIPIEEIRAIADMMKEQSTAADGFSRAYSDKEEARSKELWQSYENGTFPEKEIIQVDNAEAVTEGTLCYINATGDFYLPDREMTDEELLEIIDFQHKMRYAIEQSPAAQEARAEMAAERARLEEMIQAAGGISQEEAIEIAQKQMESELGEKAEGKEILRHQDGSVAVLILEISEREGYGNKGELAYYVIFSNPNENDHSTYYCTIDAVDGSVLHTE